MVKWEKVPIGAIFWTIQNFNASKSGENNLLLDALN